MPAKVRGQWVHSEGDTHFIHLVHGEGPFTPAGLKQGWCGKLFAVTPRRPGNRSRCRKCQEKIRRGR